MNKIQFEKLLKPLVSIYDEIELDLIRNVLERLNTYKSVQGSIEWYLEKLADIGGLDRDNLNVIKNNKKEIEKILKEIATKSGTHIKDLDTLNSYFDKGLININPKELFKSTAINNLINEALKDTENIMNLINTKAIESTKESYMKILNKAYAETASGVYSYEESIRQAIKEFAKEGIKGATYESGKTISIEAVVRRDVITRMNKLVGDCELEHAKELGTNLVYVDQHLGARVRTKYMKHDYEAHVEWQGKKYMLEGSNDKYDNFYEKTGYGEMLGLKGINCYHNFRPTWEWEKIEPVIDEVKNKNAYEQLEKQRAFERKIRELKRQKVASKDIDSEEYSKINNKLKKTNIEFDNWLKEKDLTRNYNREFVEKTREKSTIKKSENQELKINYNLLGFDNEYKQKIINTFETLKSKYPVDNINVKSITNKSRFGQSSTGVDIHKVRNKQEFKIDFENEIGINRNLMKNEEISSNKHLENYKIRGSKLTDSLATVYHEYAHIIDLNYSIKTTPRLKERIDKIIGTYYLEKVKLLVNEAREINKLIRTNTLSNRIWDGMKEKLNVSSDIEFKELVSKEFGTYAIKNKKEFLAEGFANMITLKDKSSFLREFERQFNEEYDIIFNKR